jgi:hypothetical protein
LATTLAAVAATDFALALSSVLTGGFELGFAAGFATSLTAKAGDFEAFDTFWGVWLFNLLSILLTALEPAFLDIAIATALLAATFFAPALSFDVGLPMIEAADFVTVWCFTLLTDEAAARGAFLAALLTIAGCEFLPPTLTVGFGSDFLSGLSVNLPGGLTPGLGAFLLTGFALSLVLSFEAGFDADFTDDLLVLLEIALPTGLAGSFSAERDAGFTAAALVALDPDLNDFGADFRSWFESRFGLSFGLSSGLRLRSLFTIHTFLMSGRPVGNL